MWENLRAANLNLSFTGSYDKILYDFIDSLRSKNP